MLERMASQHITRCNKEFGAFNGWRFCITRFKHRLVRYFSDLEYGSKQQARAEAEAYRDRIYALLSENPGNEAAILQQLASEYRNQQTRSTALRPHVPCANKRKAITFRITPQLHSTLETLGEFMGLETSSIIRLALYHYLTHIVGFTERPTPQQLQEHLTELEAQAAAVGLPSFVELMTNTTRYQAAYPPSEDTHLEAAEEYEP